MTPQEIADILRAQFGERISEVAVDGPHPSVTVAPECWPAVARLLRDDARMRFNFLRCISGLDLHPEPWLELVFELISMRPGPASGDLWQAAGLIAIRTRVPREGGSVGTVADVWPAAEWHEREAFDLLGIRFDGHPDLRRILCPDDWAGWPLRKDYEFPKEYHGIPSAAAPAAEN